MIVLDRNDGAGQMAFYLLQMAQSMRDEQMMPDGNKDEEYSYRWVESRLCEVFKMNDFLSQLTRLQEMDMALHYIASFKLFP